MKKLGRVMKVFLPYTYELNDIGFKIEIDDKVITVIEKQNIDNVKIYRDDFVYVEITNIDGEVSYVVEPISDKGNLGEAYE